MKNMNKPRTTVDVIRSRESATSRFIYKVTLQDFATCFWSLQGAPITARSDSEHSNVVADRPTRMKLSKIHVVGPPVTDLWKLAGKILYQICALYTGLP